MRTVNVSWDKEAGRFSALGRSRGQVVSINAPPKPTEEHRGPTGFSPTELLLAGAGSCAAWDVVEILRKRRHDIVALDVAVDGDQDADPPWAYRTVTLHFRIAGEGLKLPVLARVIRLSIVRYCSVIATIAGTAAIAATIELVESDGKSAGRVPIELALRAVPARIGIEPTADEDE